MNDEVEIALEELANRFAMAGETTWTSAEVADAIRRFAAYPEDPLTNRDDEGGDTALQRSRELYDANSRRLKDEE